MNVREVLIEHPWANLKQQRLFWDRFLRWFWLGAVLLMIAIWILLAVQLRPSDFFVTFEYTGGITSGQGPWYMIYSYGLFSLITTLGNIALATACYDRSRIASFFLLVGAIVLNAFTLVITHTLLTQIG